MTQKAHSQPLNSTRPRFWKIKRFMLFLLAVWCLLVIAYGAGYSQFFLNQNLIVPQSFALLILLALFAPLLIIGVLFFFLSFLNNRPMSVHRSQDLTSKKQSPVMIKAQPKNHLQEKEKAIQSSIESSLQKIQNREIAKPKPSRIFARAVHDDFTAINMENINPQAAPFIIHQSDSAQKPAVKAALSPKLDDFDISIERILPYCDFNKSAGNPPHFLLNLSKTGQSLAQLLLRDDIVLEDLRLAPINVDLWRKFAQSRTGEDFSALAAVQDLSAISMANHMQRNEQEFRDLALGFQAEFIDLLPKLVSGSSDMNIEDFINSDIGRLFMLLGNISGILVDKR